MTKMTSADTARAVNIAQEMLQYGCTDGEISISVSNAIDNCTREHGLFVAKEVRKYCAAKRPPSFGQELDKLLRKHGWTPP